MGERAQLVGGPLDGGYATACPGRYSWVKPRGGRLRVLRTVVAGGRSGPGVKEMVVRSLPGADAMFLVAGAATSHPRDGAALYEKGRDGKLLYAGHRVYLCGGCGAYHGKCEGGSERRPCALGGNDGAR